MFLTIPIALINLVTVVYIFSNFKKTLDYMKENDMEQKYQFMKKMVIVYAATVSIGAFLSLVEMFVRIGEPDLDSSFDMIWFWDKYEFICFTIMVIGYMIVLKPSSESYALSNYADL